MAFPMLPASCEAGQLRQPHEKNSPYIEIYDKAVSYHQATPAYYHRQKCQFASAEALLPGQPFSQPFENDFSSAALANLPPPSSGLSLVQTNPAPIPRLNSHGQACGDAILDGMPRPSAKERPPPLVDTQQEQRNDFTWVSDGFDPNKRPRRQDNDGDTRRKRRMGDAGGSCDSCWRVNKQCDGDDPCKKCRRNCRQSDQQLWPCLRALSTTSDPAELCIFDHNSSHLFRWAEPSERPSVRLYQGTSVTVEVEVQGLPDPLTVEFAALHEPMSSNSEIEGCGISDNDLAAMAQAFYPNDSCSGELEIIKSSVLHTVFEVLMDYVALRNFLNADVALPLIQITRVLSWQVVVFLLHRLHEHVHELGKDLQFLKLSQNNYCIRLPALDRYIRSLDLSRDILEAFLKLEADGQLAKLMDPLKDRARSAISSLESSLSSQGRDPRKVERGKRQKQQKTFTNVVSKVLGTQHYSVKSKISLKKISGGSLPPNAGAEDDRHLYSVRQLLTPRPTFLAMLDVLHETWERAALFDELRPPEASGSRVSFERLQGGLIQEREHSKHSARSQSVQDQSEVLSGVTALFPISDDSSTLAATDDDDIFKYIDFRPSEEPANYPDMEKSEAALAAAILAHPVTAAAETIGQFSDSINSGFQLVASGKRNRSTGSMASLSSRAPKRVQLEISNRFSPLGNCIPSSS